MWFVWQHELILILAKIAIITVKQVRREIFLLRIIRIIYHFYAYQGETTASTTESGYWHSAKPKKHSAKGLSSVDTRQTTLGEF